MRIFNRFVNVALVGLLFVAALLAGCSDEFIPLKAEKSSEPFQIEMTVPHHQQPDVVLSSQVVVYFSEELNPLFVSDRVAVEDEFGINTLFTLEVYRASIVISPVGLWKPHTTYNIKVSPGVRSVNNKELTAAHSFTFSTGVRRPCDREALSVVRVSPATDEICWDFHTIRLYFNEPIDRRTLEYGQSVRMIDVDTGEQIAGNLFGRRNQIVFDPAQDLTAGKTYRLIVNNMLKDYSGDGLLEDFTVDFIPRSTGNRTHLAMDKVPTVVEGSAFVDALPDDSLFPKSKFIDRDINSMLANSVMMGETNIKVGSRLWNEFGEAALSPDRIPFVVRKGQRLRGKGLKGTLGGEITTGVDTGEVVVTVMTDAIGEMLGSEYVHGVKGLPPVIRLTMDATMNTTSPTANAILSQPILGVTLVGQVGVEAIDQVPDYEAMEIEIIGFAEIELVNEFVPVTMALKMVPPPIKPEEEPFDEAPLEVMSVSPVDIVCEPEDITSLVPTRMAGEEIIVTFNKAVDPNTVRGNLTLRSPDGVVPGRFDIYNPKVAFIPYEPLDPDTTYTIIINDGFTDILGNKLDAQHTYQFATMPFQASYIEPPLINASVPGRYENATLPKNFYPEVYFSQIIDEDSLVYGESIALYDMTYGRELVPGTFIYSSIFVRFVPDEDLTPGHNYLMVVRPGVLSIAGLQVDTDSDRTPGGPEVEIPFKAVPYSPYVRLAYSTYPYADADVNGFIEGDEYEIDTNYMEMDFPLIKDRSYTMGYFPVTIQSLQVDADGFALVPVNIEPGSYIYASSVSMSLFGGEEKTEPGFMDMGRISIGLLDPSSTDLYQADDGLTGVDVDTTMLFNVENKLFNAFLNHETFLKIPSKLRFTRDGRLVVIVHGEGVVQMQIPLLGAIDIPLIVDMMNITPPSRRGF